MARFGAPLAFFSIALVLSILAALGFERVGLLDNPWLPALALATTSLGVPATDGSRSWATPPPSSGCGAAS